MSGEPNWLDKAIADAEAVLASRPAAQQTATAQRVDQHAAAVRAWFASRSLPITRANITAYAQGIVEAGTALGLGPDSTDPRADVLGLRVAGAYQLLKDGVP